MHIAIKNEKIDLSTENKTEKFASIISKKLKPGNVVFLYGELGVGKTTFVKYLINAFQKENKSPPVEVVSPTFGLLSEYQINKTLINHYDLYRLKSINELGNLDLFENISSKITLVEWPQIIEEKPKNLIELKFNYENNYQGRSVIIKGLNL